MKRLLLTGLALIPLAAGCGGGSEGTGGNAGVELTKRLPDGESSYVAVDLDGLRDGTGLDADAELFPPPEGAEPLVTFATGAAISGFFTAPLDPEVLTALDPGSASAIASSRGDFDGLTVIATDADPEIVRGDLEKLGYDERDGILTHRGERAGFIVEDGLILAAARAADLGDLPEEPAGDLPESLLERADGVYVDTLEFGDDCLQATATSLDTDGTGEVSYRVDGEPDPDKLNFEDTDAVTFAEPEVDGDTISIAGSGEPDAVAIRDAVQENFFFYDC